MSKFISQLQQQWLLYLNRLTLVLPRPDHSGGSAVVVKATDHRSPALHSCDAHWTAVTSSCGFSSNPGFKDLGKNSTHPPEQNLSSVFFGWKANGRQNWLTELWEESWKPHMQLLYQTSVESLLYRPILVNANSKTVFILLLLFLIWMICTITEPEQLPTNNLIN